MDWTGEHLIRAPKRPAPAPTTPHPSRKRVPSESYIAASRAGVCLKDAADALGVSSVAVWKAAERLGLTFRDGRRNG